MLERSYSGAVYDVLREMGIHDRALPPVISPIDPKRKIVGPVFTVEGHITKITEDESLLKWCDMLSRVPRGYILVCQPNDDTVAHLGELSVETLSLRGVRGCLVDGGCRDTGFIVNLEFPVFCRYLSPADIVGKWAVEKIDEPIIIGGVSINKGDYIMGDRDGAIMVPKDAVEECVNRLEELMNTESEVRKAIRAGVDPKEAYLKYGRF